MSLYDYKAGLKITINGYPFYGLIQAAMRQADTDNLEALKIAFPETWKELQSRYNAPSGVLPGD